MAELTLAHEQKILLRARAHRLEPVVRLGSAGLSDAALREIDRALRSHGLIKVRAAGAPRTERETLSRTIAERLGAAQIQVIGNTLILFRPVPETAAPAAVPGASQRPAGASKQGSKSRAPARKAHDLPKPSLATPAPRRGTLRPR